MTAASAWSPGQQVMARDVSTRGWRRAWVEKPARVRDRHGRLIADGAYILWADIAPDPDRDRVFGTPSAGGWSREIVDGWDEGAAAMDALAFALRCVGDFAARKAERDAAVRP